MRVVYLHANACPCRGSVWLVHWIQGHSCPTSSLTTCEASGQMAKRMLQKVQTCYWIHLVLINEHAMKSGDLPLLSRRLLMHQLGASKSKQIWQDIEQIKRVSENNPKSFKIHEKRKPCCCAVLCNSSAAPGSQTLSKAFQIRDRILPRRTMRTEALKSGTLWLHRSKQHKTTTKYHCIN